MKKIRFLARVPAEVRAIPQAAALSVLKALHRYIETGESNEKPLSGRFEGLLRLRAGNQPVLFDETVDTITIHRVRASEGLIVIREGPPMNSTTKRPPQPAKERQSHRIGPS